jgi:hypothetical protein
MNLINGMSDSLDILSFKWKSIRPKSQRVWIVIALAFAIGVVLSTAYFGTVFRLIISLPISGSEEVRNQLLIGINIFLADNASLAAGGVLWALIASVLVIPLVGYSFASIVPEGDLASIKITDNHKISDSLFLQFVSSISFLQITTLTSLTSILVIGSDTPGLGIVTSWLLWTLATMTTVLAAWFFEYLVRKFGIKAKVISLVLIAAIAATIFLVFPKDAAGMFGVGEAYTHLVQGLNLGEPLNILYVLLVFIVSAIGIGALISVLASRTLQLPEKTKKKDRSKIFIARLGFAHRNNISGISPFLANMILRQSNIWKPLLLSVVFSLVMSVVFFAFYEVLFTVATLIPIMITLVWSINIFGILGSGTTWLVSLPEGKQKILGSIAKIQYVIIGMIAIGVVALILAFYQADTKIYTDFLISTTACSLVITQFALEKAVKFPYRYRVHIRGESVLPPNKAFSYMAKLFFIGFLISGLMYGVGNTAVYVSLGLPAYTASIVQIVVLGIVAGIVYIKFRLLQRRWLMNSEVLQNIVKTVGSS